jgi:3',5'-cyclic AMP phosphodiesterase CpdA
MIVLLAFLLIRLVPGIGQEPAFHFLMLADTQLGMHASDKNFEQEKANYEFAVAAINRLKPKFVIILGDLVNKPGDRDQLREFLKISRTIDPFIPLYLVPGNHDVGQAPTPETLAAYRKNIGRDYYSFREGPVYGIVLNSGLICEPKNVMDEYERQNEWLRRELEAAQSSGAAHIIVFQHHPLFTQDALEPAQWGSVPPERRKPLLELLHRYGVRHVFAGHVHRNMTAADGDLEAVATGPVAMPFGEDGSGIRVVSITAAGVQHRYYDFGRLPNKLDVK